MPLSLSLAFRTDRFDTQGELPEHANAGNQFYGQDVALFLSEGLTALGTSADYIDEDWGWLVQSTGTGAATFDIAIYYLSEHVQDLHVEGNEWGLWIRSYEKRKILGLIPKRTEVAVPSELQVRIASVFAKAGIELTIWQDGPDADS